MGRKFYDEPYQERENIQYNAVGITGLSKILKLINSNDPGEREELQRCFKESRVFGM